MSRSRLAQTFGLAVWLLVAFSAAAIGAWATIEAEAFYAQLVRPSWAPPAWVFGPVWTALYVLMALAAWLVWRVHGVSGARGPLLLFGAQLALNALWSWLFFGWQQGWLAFVEILALWVVLASTVVAFWRIQTAAGLLLVPYLLWVSFAAVLTWSIWRGNPTVLS